MIKAVVFDMNGVIINDEKFHKQSWTIFCQRYGFKLSPQEFDKEVMGKRDKETLEYLFKKKLTPDEINNYANERDEIVKPLVNNNLQLTKGLQKLLEDLKQAHIPVAIATSSRKGYMNFIMDNFNLRKYFKHIITAEDIVNGKPDPEIYLKTALLLQKKPEDCLVFEDSLSGIKSAKNAGMNVIAITTTHNKNELSLADQIIDSFEDISVDDLNVI